MRGFFPILLMVGAGALAGPAWVQAGSGTQTSDLQGQTRLRVESDPPGEVFINGQSQGLSPVDLDVEPGVHVVRVVVPNRAPFTQTVTLVPGDRMTVRAQLQHTEWRYIPHVSLGIALPLGADGMNTAFETSADVAVRVGQGPVDTGMHLSLAWAHGLLATALPQAGYRMKLPVDMDLTMRLRAGVGLTYACLTGDPAFTDGESGSLFGLVFAASVGFEAPVAGDVMVFAQPLGIDVIPPWIDFPHTITRLHLNAGVGGRFD